ncbi:unnamed protein product, partial [Polarella glacialis]
CNIAADATACQVAATGDAALQVTFSQSAATSLVLDMSSTTSCGASGEFCPQVFMVTSDHVGNTLALSLCSYYKQSDYSSHIITYTFMNVGNTHAFTVMDGNQIGRAVVPPGALRECFCHCSGTCATDTNNRLYCTHASQR